jgi:hypothetical protein
MDTKSVIMVQISDDRKWTLEALHCACLLARKMSARIALVKMISVDYPAWLGADLGYMNFTYQEHADFVDYQATIEDYGVEFTPLLFQYVSLAGAIAQAAEHVNAQMVLAKIPESTIPLWTKFQEWTLHRQLVRQKREWIQHPVYDRGASKPIPEAVAEIDHH